MAQIFNISSSAQFLDELALGLIERFSNLADVTVFLPSKRAIFGLQKAIARHSSGAMFLPKIEALGDVDEDEFVLRGFPHIERLPQAITQTERLLKITKMILVQDLQHQLNSAQALQIAQKLCALLDEFYNRKAKFDDLENIVPVDYAEHWAKTLDFLDVVLHKWQKYKAENSLLDEVERRNLLLVEVAKYWREFPPQKPIVIAGTTATIPATQELIASVCGTEHGYLVLFGLDRNLSAEDFALLEPTHPQYNLAQLLASLGNPQVENWGAAEATSRQQLLSMALLPKWRVEEWQNFVAAPENLQLIECKNAEQEASVIAIVLREAYAKDERSALVTNNRALAKRVHNKLAKWGIEAENSYRENLANNDIGQLIILIAEFFASKQAPVKALALFKHGLVSEGLREKIYAVEKEFLRGLRPENFCISEHVEFLNFANLANLFEQKHVDLQKTLQAILLFAEELSKDSVFSDSNENEIGKLNDLLKEIAGFGEIDTLIIADFMRNLLSSQSINSYSAGDKKIKILSLIESRFDDSDLIILSGLNEGDFPQISRTGDLLNQHMRRQLGLDLPERKIGQQAHDFELLSQAPRVVYTRAKKDSGAPTVTSRFLQALRSLIELDSGEKYQGWMAQIRAADIVVPCSQPAPTPPASARPKELAVTKIEQLMRDPYVIYAQKILGLRKLNDLDAEITPADFGNFVHLALEKYDKVYDGTLETLLQCGEDILQEKYQNRKVLRVFWLPRFAKLAEWVLVEERKARGSGKQILAEYKAEIVIGDFTLTARADRLEKSSSAVRIIDYKTGTMPTDKDVKLGISPQMSLEALIFSEAFGLPIEACEFWQTKGSEEDKIHVVKADMAELIDEARVGVANLIEKFANEKTPYIARPRPKLALRYNDFAHLARIEEWE